MNNSLEKKDFLTDYKKHERTQLKKLKRPSLHNKVQEKSFKKTFSYFSITKWNMKSIYAKRLKFLHNTIAIENNWKPTYTVYLFLFLYSKICLIKHGHQFSSQSYRLLLDCIFYQLNEQNLYINLPCLGVCLLVCIQ